MAKDKPAKKISMKEHIASKAKATNESKGNNDAPVFKSSYDEDHNNKLKEYNTKINEIDKLYSSLNPRFDVLVRVYVNPMEVKDGVLMPNTVPVKAPTNSNVGYIGAMETSHPYSKKAVVIAVPEEIKDLKVGDTVVLSETPVKAQAVGKGDNAYILIPNRFIHPDEANKYPVEQPIPVDPTDRNYGYLLVKPFDIKIKL